MKRVFAVGLFLAATLLASCGEAPTPGTIADFGTVCDRANDGKRVALEGYLTLPDQLTEDSSVVLRLRAEPGFDTQPVGVTMGLGSGPHQMDAVTSDPYSDEDLAFRSVDGQTLGYTDRVRVSGTVYFPVLDTVDFDCGLNNPYVEAAPGS